LRLTSKEIDIIRNKVETIFSKSVIYLFGSRVYDDKKGGDIDLYIVPQDKQDNFSKKLRLKSVLEDLLFKPVDIVIAKDETRVIEQEALQYGIKL